nr:MAG TPA: hypothetical protein [Caudoviricetes sp.]
MDYSFDAISVKSLLTRNIRLFPDRNNTKLSTYQCY